MKKTIILFTAAILAALTATAAALQHQQQVFSEKLIRLHVVANSDSQEDQELKLKVRDAVLTVTENLTDKNDLENALPQVLEAAQTCLEKNDSQYKISVQLGKEQFPTRVYDTFSLPAGCYTALRVTIGAGEGHNWWCVAFPSICFRATAEDLEEAAVSAGFTEEEVKLITEDEGGYVLKFKALELLQEVKDRLLRR